MARELEIVFVESGVIGRVELLDDEAPRTCRAVWDAMPRSGPGSHAMYSGTVGALFFDDDSIGDDIGEENATSNVQTGDVMFTHYARGMRHGHLNGLSEVYWAYDRYVRPTIPGQHLPAIANVFGRVVGSADEVAAFYEMSRRLHSEGFKQIEMRRRE